MQPSDIAKELAHRGVSVVRGLAAHRAFSDLAGRLGSKLLETRVALDRSRATYLAQRAQVPFHCDHPDVSTIGWFCEAQDHEDGTSLFVDSHAFLDTPLREALVGETLPVPGLRRLDGPTKSVPVLQGNRLFYAPWLARPGSLALARLATKIATSSALPVRLEAGDAVFIDNHRILHGRAAISEDSTRKLTRWWLG